MMDQELASLRHHEDQIHTRLERVRLDAASLARRREHVAARLAIYERTLAENAPFRAQEAKPEEAPATLDELRAREDSLMREGERLRRAIEGKGIKRELPLLGAIQIASPCDARWSEMVGDHRVRHCLQCDKDVFNLSQLDAVEAEALLREKTGGACFRLHRRVDGTVLTQDCPSGVRRRLLGRIAGSVMVFGLLLAAGSYVVAELWPKPPAERQYYTQMGFQ